MDSDSGKGKGEAGGMYWPKDGLQGDTGGMPNKGTSTAVTDTYGADIGPSATNRIGRLTGTDSDGMEAA